MKNFALAGLGFLVGIAITCAFFLHQAPPPKIEPPPIAAVQPIPPVAPAQECGPSKEILPPPQFSAKLPEKLETNHEAEVRVAWDGVNGAKSYNIFVTDARGRLVKKYSTTHTAIFLKDIPTPPDIDQIEYKVFLTTVNGNNLDGDKSEGRALKVNRQASVVAPTVKNIVVED